MKTFLRRIVIALTATALFTFSAAAAESLSVLLQKGIYAEETEGNLDSAIKIYEQIGADAATNRAGSSLAELTCNSVAICKATSSSRAKAAFTALIAVALPAWIEPRLDIGTPRCRKPSEI